MRGLAITFFVVLAIGCGGGAAHDDVKSANTASSAPMSKGKVIGDQEMLPKILVVEDFDHDGIENDTDRCMKEAEDKDGFEDDDGCPDGDDDKDGILDGNDKCPREAETYNGIDDADGCPDKLKIVIIDPPAPVVHYVRFVGPGAVIAAESRPMLHDVAEVMKANPEIVLVEVEGHTDENGNAGANVKLSQLRAQAVVDALVELGVEAARLRAQGFGGYCPLDPAHTPVAWEKNRRAEFRVLKKDDGPTSVATGCAEATAHGVVSAPVP